MSSKILWRTAAKRRFVRMPITIRVVNDNEFKAWVEAAKKKYAVDQAAPPTAIAAAGASVR